MKKIEFIDTFRAFAIIGVIVLHTSQYGSSSNLHIIFRRIIGEGARGVQLFYLASAFTLFLSFKYRSGKEKSPIRNFFLRRFFRIAPMYYLGIIYYLYESSIGFNYYNDNGSHITFLNILSNFTFLHGFNPYWINSLVPGGWSIGVEMVFYATLPILFSKIKSINQAFNFFITAIFLRLILSLFFNKIHLIDDKILWNEYLFLYFPSQLPVFCLGILLYFVIIENESLRNISGKSILIFCCLLFFQLGTGGESIFPRHILFSFGFLILGFSLSTFRFNLFINPIVSYIGKISFSMYLVHFAVLHWLAYFKFVDFFKSGSLNFATRFFIVSVSTILISSILYRIIEVPFQKIGKKIINKLEKI